MRKHDYGAAMRVVITGATGFIGNALCAEFHKDYEVVALSRNADSARRSIGHLATVVQWDAKTPAGWDRQADGAFAIVNLAGDNVGSGRWNKAKKSRILQSRLDASSTIVETIKQLSNKPAVLVQASAVGYYGSRRDEQLHETSGSGEGFLADVCKQTERFEDEIEALGVRYVAIRTGIVMGRDGGALKPLMKQFRFYLGGYLGSGRQWFSWIALEDEVAAIRFLMENEHLSGAFNLTSPQPVRMKEFCMVLGSVLHRPVWLRVPGIIARFALGDMADEMLLSGQRVLPKRLLEAGFEFKYQGLERALSAINDQRRRI
ncbi:MAG: TIGR01777 family oxidoreductase [Planctomycetota bacterium]